MILLTSKKENQMKKIMSGFGILLLCFVLMTNYTYANEKSWEYKDWNVSTHDKFVRYMTNGDTVHGHQFGFIKMIGNCNRDLLWISWSTYEDGIEAFKGSDAIIQLRIGETQIQIEVPILSVYNFTPLLKVIGFSNFIAGEKLISLLKKEHTVEVTIIAPKELVAKLDVTTDTFSLNGYTATALKSVEFCTAPKVDLLDKKDQETAETKKAIKSEREPSTAHIPMIYDDGWKTLTEKGLAERMQRPVLNINNGEPFNFKVVNKNDKEIGRVNTPAEYYKHWRKGNRLLIETTYDEIDRGLFKGVAMPLIYLSKAKKSKYSYVRDFPFDDKDPLSVLPVRLSS